MGPQDPTEATDDDGVGGPNCEAETRRRRVVLLAGPSGAGKSRLAARLTARSGWPVVRLDDFYREIDDPRLPRSDLGIADWDHPQSWDIGAALCALRTLTDTGDVEVPVYDIASSRIQGRRRLTARPGGHVIAEGLFAARLVAPLRGEGRLAQALCVRQNRYLTAVRRFVRDLAERRKPLPILVRRGLSLLRAEPDIVAAAAAQGARPVTPREAERHLAPLLSDPARRSPA